MPSYFLGAGFWTQDISNAIAIVILPNANKVHPCLVYPRGNKRSHSGSRAGHHVTIRGAVASPDVYLCFCHRFSLFPFPISGCTKNDVVDGPCL